MAEKKIVYEFEEFRLEAEKQRLYRNNEVVLLPPKAIELLILFVENQGQILEKENIIETLWKDTFVEESNLTQTIYLLRKALGKSEDGNLFIATLPKRGYKFVPPVRQSFINKPSRIPEPPLNSGITAQQKEETNQIVTTLKPAQTSDYNEAAKISGTKPFSFLAGREFLLGIFLAILLIGVVAFVARQNGSAEIREERRKTLVVVPFSVIGDDERKNYLGLGLADTLITRLGKTGKINVRPTEEIQRYADAEKDPVQLARKLNADVVLTGTIQQIDGRARLNTQLINIGSGQIVWSKQFDESVSNLFTLQDKATADLAEALTLSLSDSEQKGINQKATENMAALKLYWEGRFNWNRRTPESIKRGIECFEEAIKLDPNFAQPYAGLADSYALTASGIPPAERLPKALTSAQRALELNENLAEAHASLAIVTYKLIWNWDSTEKHFKRAIELNESYATAHHWYGEYLILMGRYDEGFRELARAEELDPFSLAVKIDTAEALYRARRYEDALVQAGKVLEIDPNNIQIRRIIKRTQIMSFAGEPEIIKTDLQIQRLSKIPPEQLAQLEKDFADQNWKSYWQKRSDYVSKLKSVSYFIEKAEILLQLNDKQAAVEQITAQIKNHELTPLLLKGEPIFDNLRSNRQFQLLLELGGFSPNT